MSSTIQIRVDDDLKQKSDLLFKELGTDTTSAVRMFLTQAVATGGFPFEIKRVTPNPYQPLSEAELLNRLESTRIKSKSEKCKDADDVISDMRSKYGL
ncbi:MAG: type II toxin-antitoxin system RelB/DinJ family antitoxin [Clostridiales bacterium]|jgi:DNA-damage-inducible protein J|nr:type II toxin-antitoxin system RelB/DinJ family antitoxin [Clostridiales bacterium]